jgi:hypothetical protein
MLVALPLAIHRRVRAAGRKLVACRPSRNKPAHLFDPAAKKWGEWERGGCRLHDHPAADLVNLRNRAYKPWRPSNAAASRAQPQESVTPRLPWP